MTLEQLITMPAQLYSRQPHDAAPHPDHARSSLDLYISTRGLENSCFMLLAFASRHHGPKYRIKIHAPVIDREYSIVQMHSKMYIICKPTTSLLSLLNPYKHSELILSIMTR